MQSETTRGIRRFLVSTGVISLVLSGLAPAALAEKPADRKVWVCHGTGSETNPYEINLVSINAEGHHGEELDDEDLQALADAGVTNKGDLNRLSASALEELIGATCGGDGGEGGDEEGGDEGSEGDDETAPGTDDTSPPDDEVVVVTPPSGGDEEAPGGVVPGTDQPTEEPAAPSDGASEPTEEQAPPIISSTTVERPAPATPAAPAAPATPATPAAPAVPAPAAPAAPARSAATGVSTAPASSVAVSATSRGNEVLGSVTTRTPGGATVAALAATGTGTTIALTTLGTVLLLAGLGLQVGARRRVRSSDVGA